MMILSQKHHEKILIIYKVFDYLAKLNGLFLKDCRLWWCPSNVTQLPILAPTLTGLIDVM